MSNKPRLSTKSRPLPQKRKNQRSLKKAESSFIKKLGSEKKGPQKLKRAKSAPLVKEKTGLTANTAAKKKGLQRRSAESSKKTPKKELSSSGRQKLAYGVRRKVRKLHISFRQGFEYKQEIDSKMIARRMKKFRNMISKNKDLSKEQKAEFLQFLQKGYQANQELRDIGTKFISALLNIPTNELTSEQIEVFHRLKEKLPKIIESTERKTSSRKIKAEEEEKYESSLRAKYVFDSSTIDSVVDMMKDIKSIMSATETSKVEDKEALEKQLSALIKSLETSKKELGGMKLNLKDTKIDEKLEKLFEKSIKKAKTIEKAKIIGMAILSVVSAVLGAAIIAGAIAGIVMLIIAFPPAALFLAWGIEVPVLALILVGMLAAVPGALTHWLYKTKDVNAEREMNIYEDFKTLWERTEVTPEAQI